MPSDFSEICGKQIWRASAGASDWLTQNALAGWYAAQYLFLFGGAALLVTLAYRPVLGLDILWNGLIPLAPALVVVVPGLWRNICPMATFSLLPRRLGLSRNRPPSKPMVALLAVISLIALFLIVPLRHLSLNASGPETALMLGASAIFAFLLGVAYDWRSGWCNGLCPIHPVEKLYGQVPAFTFYNARCDVCHQCSTPCPDSTRSMQPLVTSSSSIAKAVGHIMTGSFAGFIWGWYRVPDYLGNVTFMDGISAYAWPFCSGLISLAVYGIFYLKFNRSTAHRRLLVRLFATFAVCAYYWYRIPALAGFEPYPGSGMLVDLSSDWPLLPWFSRFSTTAFFTWFLLMRRNPGASWLKRPSRAPNSSAATLSVGLDIK